MNVRFVVAAVSGVAVLAGCPSVSTTGLARTMNRGSIQGFIAPGFITLEGVTLPQIEAGGRYAVSDRVEIGAKLWLIGAGVDGKFALLRAPSMQSGMDLSIDPMISYLGLGADVGDTSGSVSMVTVVLPVLIGINFSGHQLILGPKAVGHGVFGTSENVEGTFASGQTLGLGGTVGLALKAGAKFRIMPEITFVQYVWSSGGEATATLIQGGVTVLFGGDYDAPAAAPPAAAQ